MTEFAFSVGARLARDCDLKVAIIVGAYDVYQNSLDVPLKESIQLPVNDPLLLVAAMAVVTRNLGFGLTANLTYEPPYLFARRMSTLDHLSRGRVGWNIVTGYLDSAVESGRNSEEIKVFMGLNVIVGATEELAWAKHAEYLSYASAEAAIF